MGTPSHRVSRNSPPAARTGASRSRRRPIPADPPLGSCHTNKLMAPAFHFSAPRRQRARRARGAAVQSRKVNRNSGFSPSALIAKPRSRTRRATGSRSRKGSCHTNKLDHPVFYFSSRRASFGEHGRCRQRLRLGRHVRGRRRLRRAGPPVAGRPGGVGPTKQTYLHTVTLFSPVVASTRRARRVDPPQRPALFRAET